MIEATGQPADQLCRACFTGEYPIALPDESLLGKHLLEATLSSPHAGRRTARAQQPVSAREPVVTEPAQPPGERLRRRRRLDRGRPTRPSS